MLIKQSGIFSHIFHLLLKLFLCLGFAVLSLLHLVLFKLLKPLPVFLAVLGIHEVKFLIPHLNQVSDGAKRRGFARLLIKAATMTVFLSVVSMPLAMLIGLLVALGRLYGPRLIQPFLAIYVEFLRGTPLMLQLFFIYFITPELLGFGLPALLASIIGLALNYSAYESEIYRAGLQAIPEGQMEAALALGMTRRQALYRIIIPQATRIVIPPVTNDFIALFKDTSVCSVITIVELTKQYSILANSTLKVLEFGLATSFLYLAMSWPLSWFARYYERRLESENEN